MGNGWIRKEGGGGMEGRWREGGREEEKGRKEEKEEGDEGRENNHLVIVPGIAQLKKKILLKNEETADNKLLILP